MICICGCPNIDHSQLGNGNYGKCRLCGCPEFLEGKIAKERALSFFDLTWEQLKAVCTK